MSKRSSAVPIYNLDNRQPFNIHLRVIRDYAVYRPAFEIPHRDDYYIFLFQQAGQCRLMVDFEEIFLEGPCVYYLLPGQVHHFISAKKAKGWLLAIEPLHINELYRKVLEEEEEHLPVAIDRGTQQQLQNCMETLHQLLDYQLPDKFRFSVLSQMVAVCAGLYTSIYSLEKQNGSYKDNESRPVFLTRQFRRLLKEYFKKEKRPAYYAASLHVSPAYLNECVRATTGRPVSYWIQQQMILEAKRLLGYSNLSIKEVAYSLGYEDYAYFIRQFTKASGSTPARFRKAYHV